MPKVKNKLLYYAHRKYGKDIIVRKEEDGILRFWTEFYAITLTLTPDGKIKEKIRKREGTSAKQHFDNLESKSKVKKSVKTQKKATTKKTTSKKSTVKGVATKVARPKFHPGDFVKSIYCDDVFTIISNDGDGMVRVVAGHVALNDTKFHSEYIMAQSDLI